MILISLQLKTKLLTKQQDQLMIWFWMLKFLSQNSTRYQYGPTLRFWCLSIGLHLWQIMVITNLTLFSSTHFTLSSMSLSTA